MATETPRDLDWRVGRVGRDITISRAERGVGNAVLSPEDEDEGCYWTLIGAGPDEQQNALAEIIARALNSSEEQSRSPSEASAGNAGLDAPPPPLQSDFDRLKEEDRLDWKAAWYALDIDAAALSARAEAAEAEVERLKRELDEAGQYTEAHKRLDDLARERVEAAEARATQAEESHEAQVSALTDRFEAEVNQLTIRAQTAEATLSEVVGVLEKNASTFRKYEALHDAKGTVDGAQKAGANAYMAKLNEALLQKLKAGVSPYVGEREGEGRQTPERPQCGTASPDGEVCGRERSVSGAGEAT